MRALTWKQPFAELMFHGKIETRKKNTDYRGDVLICAGLEQFNLYEIKSLAGEEQLKRIQEKFGSNLLYHHGWGMGYAIGVGTLVDSRRMEPVDEEKCFVKYSPLLYCYVYENVRKINPFKFKGAQGWTSLKESDIKKIRFL